MTARGSEQLAQRAVVIGASMAGLLTARVLSEFFGEVIVVERDVLPTDVSARKGVPQGHHVHVLLAAGAEVLDDLFPDLFAAIEAQGGLCMDMCANNNWFHFGTWKRRFDCGVRVRFQSRLLLEHEVRARVLSLPNVRLEHASVLGVDWATPHLVHTSGSSLTCDLLVDASGRGSPMSRWLAEGGYTPAEREDVEVNVTYTSARFVPGAEQDWRALLIYPSPPDGKRAGAALPIEGGEVIVSLFGWCGEQVVGEDEAFGRYAETLPQPEIKRFLESAKRVGAYHSVRYKRASYRHYERLSEFPARTCVVGDALCSVDPVFGQGMTLAALSAKLLRDCARASAGADALATSFRQRVPQVLGTAWQLSTGEDFRYPDVVGRRPLGTGFAHWYTRHVQHLTSSDEDVYRRFARVMNMLEPPTALFHPSVLGKVAWLSLRGARPMLQRPRGAAR